MKTANQVKIFVILHNVKDIFISLSYKPVLISSLKQTYSFDQISFYLSIASDAYYPIALPNTIINLSNFQF